MSSFALKNIGANPFRHMDRYPIRREKVNALRESLRSTGFWDNVVARQRNGRAEIAYGHHRLVALREEYDSEHEIELIIRDLDDGAMLQIMARENMEEWGTSAAIEHETVRAVVQAYGAGQVELSVPDGHTHHRFAPSFVPGDPDRGSRDHPYNAQTVADFLGWTTPAGGPQEKVKNALAALEFIEQGLLSEADFDGLTTKQAEAVLGQARRVAGDRERLAKLHEQQAAEAARAAQEAEHRRAEAERERSERQAEAARARDAAQRRESEAAAERAAKEEAAAEEQQRTAERRRAAAERRSQEERSRARRDATTVGQAVSREIKAGNIGYRDAPTVTAQVVDRVEGPPPQLDDLVRRLATDLNNILDQSRDQRRIQRLDVFVEYRDDIAPSVRSDIVLTLRQLAQRAERYAHQLEGEGGDEGPRLLGP